jgi:hypothetical protein
VKEAIKCPDCQLKFLTEMELADHRCSSNTSSACDASDVDGRTNKQLDVNDLSLFERRQDAFGVQQCDVAQRPSLKRTHTDGNADNVTSESVEQDVKNQTQHDVNILQPSSGDKKQSETVVQHCSNPQGSLYKWEEKEEHSTQIQTFAFIDIESTGLAGGSKNPRITEICVVCIHRNNLENTALENIPRVINKMTLIVNPQTLVSHGARFITGDYCNLIVEYA